jgi:hypothetical protein
MLFFCFTTLSVCSLYSVEWYDGWWIMKVLFRHFHGVTDVNYENLCQNSRCIGLDSIEHNSTNIMFLHIIHRPVYLKTPSCCSSSIDWAQLSRFYLEMETESSLRNVFWKINRTEFLDKDRTIANVQKHNIYTNIPSSQTFRSCSSTVLPIGFASRRMKRIYEELPYVCRLHYFVKTVE